MIGRLWYFAMLLPLILEAGLVEEHFAKARKKMVATIEEDVRLTRHQLGREKLDPRVVDAMVTVPRHAFVPFAYRLHAYRNRPLPIGHGQTISQPYIVAVMTDLVGPTPGAKVLEIGTGSGYQAAVLSELAGTVYSVEVIPELARSAKERLKRLGYENVKTRIGDGYYGWKEHAPYDAIVVTAAAGHIPPPLIEQLKPGGKMIIPVKGYLFVQHLVLVTKERNGRILTRQLLPVRFVPLTGSH